MHQGKMKLFSFGCESMWHCIGIK